MSKYFWVILCLALISCSGGDEKQGASNLISLNPDEVEEIKLSDIISEVDFVKLSANDNFYIGEIEKILVTENKIYVLDAYRSSGLFVFDRNGNTLFKIQNYGRGPGEFIGPRDFTVDEQNEQIIIYSAAETKLSFYDKEDGSFIKDKPLNFWIGRFEKLDEGFVFFLNNQMTKDTEYNLVFTDNDLKITDEFLKMDQGLIGYHLVIPMNFYTQNNSTFFISPSDYNVYYIDNSERSFQILKQFDFGNKKLPDSYFEKHPDNESRREEGKNAVSTILSYLEGSGFESMFYSINTTTYTYLRSKETNKVIHTNNEKLEMDMNIGPMYRWPRTAYENNLVWYQQPGALLRNLNEIKDTMEEDEWAKFVNENRKLVSFAQTLTGDENPYLIFTRVSF